MRRVENIHDSIDGGERGYFSSYAMSAFICHVREVKDCFRMSSEECVISSEMFFGGCI